MHLYNIYKLFVNKNADYRKVSDSRLRVLPLGGGSGVVFFGKERTKEIYLHYTLPYFKNFNFAQNKTSANQADVLLGALQYNKKIIFSSLEQLSF